MFHHIMIWMTPTPEAGDHGCVPRDPIQLPDADLLVESSRQQLSCSRVNQFIALVAIEPDECEILGLSDRPEEHVPAFLDRLFMSLLHFLLLPSDSLLVSRTQRPECRPDPRPPFDWPRARHQDPQRIPPE